MDPYIDPRSGILRNKFGLSSQESLDVAEANAVSVRSVLLQMNPLPGNFDSEHLKSIHRYLFQDVYDWAGEPRSVTLAKQDFSQRSKVTHFTLPTLIDSELQVLFDKLAKDGFLQALSRRMFAVKIAELFAEINRIHPFREGNGRAQRQFVRQLAASNGYKLHFGVVSKERLVQASILSTNGDLGMMQRLMDEITDTERIQPLIGVIEHFKKHGFNWNDVYLSTTTSGQKYVGEFAGSNGTDFFFRDDTDRIIVGRMKDITSKPKSGDKIEFVAT